MYFLDPQRGRRRRVLARGGLNRITHKTTDAVGTTSRDLRNRAYGIMAETKSLVSRKQVSDEVLAERVRARLGSLVSHASSIQVRSDNGRIMLSGTVFSAELARLVRGVSSIRGVTGVENLLTVQESSEATSGQVGGSPWPAAFDFVQKPWSTTTRLVIGGLGGLLAVCGAVRRNINGGTIALLGMALLAKALSTAGFLRLAEKSDASSARGNGAAHRIGTRNGEGASE
jgi:hypothetical protein